MLLNNAISAGVGFVPIVGDIILAMYKANSRNAALLEEYLRVRGEEFLRPEGERKQNSKDVKPGAGRKPNENIPIPGQTPPLKSSHTATALSTAGGWFRRGSKGNKKDNNNKSVEESETSEAMPVLAVSPSSDRGRFVEDVPPSTTQTNNLKCK